MQETNYFPIAISGELPDVTSDSQMNSIRRVLGYLKTYGTPDAIMNTVLGQLSNIKSPDGTILFSDLRKTAPSVVLAEVLSYIGALSDFKSANVPLLIEDYILSLRGEKPIPGLPEFVYIVYRLEAPLTEDYTIREGKIALSDDGLKRYKAVYPLTIPAGNFGTEVSTQTGEYLYQQLYRSTSTGSANKVATKGLKKVENNLPYVKELWNPEPSFGGRNPERFGDYRIRAFQSPEDTLTITADDYALETKLYLGTGSRAIVVGNENYEDAGSINKIKISGINPNGDPLTNSNGAIALVEYLKTKDPNAEVVIVPPVFTDITIDLSVVFEKSAPIDNPFGLDSATYKDVKLRDLINNIVQEFVKPSNWSDWGEYENNITTEKITARIIARLVNIVDSVEVTWISYRDEYGNLVETTGRIPQIKLASIVGLPRIKLRNFAWRKEFGR